MEQNKIIIYQTEDGQTQIDVRMENDTVWLTQAQMAELFDSSRTNIVEHIQHIYEDEELDDISTCRKFRQVRLEGKRKVTNYKKPFFQRWEQTHCRYAFPVVSQQQWHSLS